MIYWKFVTEEKNKKIDLLKTGVGYEEIDSYTEI